MRYLAVLLLMPFALTLPACGDDDGGGGYTCDCCGMPVRASSSSECGGGICDPYCLTRPDSGSDAGEDAAEDAAPDVMGDGGMTLMEMEPNDGTTADEVNDLPLDSVMVGAIDAAGDTDIFLVPTMGGRGYVAQLTVGGVLMGHLTVLDSGRGGEAAGSDYVHLSRTNEGEADVEVSFAAMGDGHLVAVRDVRSLDGGAGSGGSDHVYELRVIALDLDSIGRALELPGSTAGFLGHAGSMVAHPFDATEGTWVNLDLAPMADMDARLFVVSEDTGSWIARNDDRGPADNTPLIDAPLTAAGHMWLIVENIDEDAFDLGYTITSTLP